MEEKEIRRIEQANPIIEVAIELGLRVQGNMSHCFRKDRHEEEEGATLFFNVAQNRFLCKTCPDVGGTVSDFICQFRGWDIEKAHEWLAHRVDFDRQTRKLYYERGKRKR